MRAARRAGRIAAITPTSAATTSTTTKIPTGMSRTGMSSLNRFHDQDRKNDANHDSNEGPDQRGHNRLPSDHRAGLTPAQPHGPQQADLARSLEDR